MAKVKRAQYTPRVAIQEISPCLMAPNRRHNKVRTFESDQNGKTFVVLACTNESDGKTCPDRDYIDLVTGQ